MHEIELIFGLLMIVAALAVIAERLAIPYPILLVLGGLLLSFIPGLPRVELDPELVFLLFLPPLLTSAAWYTSWREFRANLKPILLLAIGLVLASTCAVAVVAHAAIQGFTWAVAFTLGAIISPPDAVAATAITGRLNVPRRIVAVLEGESLVNDATGLVAYRFAVAAAVTGAFSLWDAGLKFVLMALGGVAVGLGVGWVAVWIHRQIDRCLVEITITLLMGYAAYLLAEHLGLSGVLAAVAIGLYHRRHSSEVMTPTTRMRTIAVWELLVFLLNGLVFILIGLQLPRILEEISQRSPLVLAGYAVLISAVVIGVRILWVFAIAAMARLLAPRFQLIGPIPPWRNTAIVAWTGMRGVVSLAAALALPLVTNQGAPFPERDLVIFLTFCVILVTLVLQGLTLPSLIQWLKVIEKTGSEREEMEARRRAAEAAMARIEELTADDEALANAQMVQWLRTQYREQLRQLGACCEAIDAGSYDQLAAYRLLQREAVAAERRIVIGLRNQGVIDDEVLLRIEHELDLEEARLSG